MNKKRNSSRRNKRPSKTGNRIGKKTSRQPSSKRRRSMKGGGLPLYYFNPTAPIIRTATEALKGGATVGAPFAQNLSKWIPKW